jgi:chitinase
VPHDDSPPRNEVASQPIVTRRLSPWRVAGAALLLIALVAAGFFGFQRWQARAVVTAPAWFAAYVDVTASPQFAVEDLGTTDTKDAVLSFIVSSPSDPCTPSWGAEYTMAEASDELDLDRRIARLEQLGGSVAVSFGGQANSELAVGCSDRTRLRDAYASVVERYRAGTIDLDLEGSALGQQAIDTRRAEAIAAVQKQHRTAGKPLAVWLTLPVTPQGMPASATDAVSAMLGAGVDVAGVNVMTMDFGNAKKPSQSMAEAAEQAVSAAHRQLGILYDRAKLHQNDFSLWAKTGATVMIGQNDVAGEVFSTADARTFNSLARSKRIGRLSMWSANRDNPCGANYVNTTVVSNSCSGVDQKSNEYSSELAGGFAGHMSLGESVVTSPQPSTTPAPDDPASSPYQVWRPAGAYLKGTKVVWHHDVYQAKWWTRGDLPDDPVLNAWQTPWQLIGPVLPGEKPIPQPTLPAGTYPTWSRSTVYEKGRRVLFEGVPYEAKWWTRGDSPEAADSDPDSSPWTPLTRAEISEVLAHRNHGD